MKLLNKKAITLVETLASVVILSFVFTIVLTLVVNARVNTIRINERVVAVNVAKTIRDSIERNYLYVDIIDNVSEGDYVISSNNCANLTNGCALFSYSVEDKTFDEEVTITFLQSTVESINYSVIHFEVSIVYYQSSVIMIEGLIYE